MAFGRVATFWGVAKACGFVAAALLVVAPTAVAQKAFPQAEGFGAEATGGRGGLVYHVTSLADTNTNGTLRYGLNTFSPSTPVTIVFDVGGWITLSSNLGITRSNVTIAGQTAPGGIGVRGGKFSVGGDDIIIRHMRFKPGKGAGREDSVNTNNNAERVIYDHISAGFSYDENFSVQATDVTLQYSAVAYGLEDHSAGSLLENPRRLTMHHNLYAHNHTRNPKHRVFDTLDWVNNVVYDYDIGFNMDGTDSVGYFWTANIDGNYYISGPGDTGRRIVSGGSVDDYGTWWGVNAYDGDGDSVHDGEDFDRSRRDFPVVWGGLTTWSDTPYPVADEVWKSPSTQAAHERVLAEFGATPWDRDEVDTLLYNNVVNRTGAIIEHENQLVSQGITNGGFGTLGGVPATLDTDRDGMADWWEIKHGLPHTRSGNNDDFDLDGFTNLEEYLNDIAAFKAVGPVEYTGSAGGRYAEWNNWNRRWEPSRLDDVVVDVPGVTVDAIGQRAGTLKILPGDGIPSVDVESGWLEVTDDIQIGADGSSGATLNLSGGKLTAHEISLFGEGEFNFTGGELHADIINFDLVNQGGTISPGNSIGQTTVHGDLTLLGGDLQIEFAPPSDFGDFSDILTVDGNVVLGGVLNVVPMDGYTPDEGRFFQILTANRIDGMFSSVTPGYSVRKQGNSLRLYVGDGPVPEPHTGVLVLFAGAALCVSPRRFGRRPRYSCCRACK